MDISWMSSGIASLHHTHLFGTHTGTAPPCIISPTLNGNLSRISIISNTEESARTLFRSTAHFSHPCHSFKYLNSRSCRAASCRTSLDAFYTLLRLLTRDGLFLATLFRTAPYETMRSFFYVRTYTPLYAIVLFHSRPKCRSTYGTQTIYFGSLLD